MSRDLFRKKALKKLVSPEQLDQLMTVTTPGGWLAVLTAALIVGAAVFWGIQGNVPTRVHGNGILMKHEGLQSIVCETSGRITQVHARTGQTIASGDVIAQIGHHKLAEKIQISRSELETMVSDQERISRQRKNQLLLKHKEADQEIRLQQQQIEKFETITRHLSNTHSQMGQLYKKGLVTEQKVFSVEKEIDRVQMDILVCRDRITMLKDEKIFIDDSFKVEEFAAAAALEKARNRLGLLSDEFETGSQIVSFSSGTLIKLLVGKGDLLNKGDIVAVLEFLGSSTDKDLEAFIFVPALEGKKIKKGMKVHVSPSTIRQEEYGFIHGSVSDVSEFPVSRKEMIHLLKNEDLADEFLKSGPPVQVKIELETDPETQSGFSWSSVKGPPVKITPGTLCTSKITVKNQSPISLVIPFLKKTFLGNGIE